MSRPPTDHEPQTPGARAGVGPVVFVGAGPGASDLITLRGAQRLAVAQVVLADALADPGLRALAPKAHWIDVGKRGFCDSARQATINALLVKHALTGQRVVRLKGGDPSIFGRLEEELAALAQAGIGHEVVPGVTAAAAAAAATARPLTRRGRGRSVSLTTAMTRVGAVVGRRTADTEVFYMAGRQLAELSRQLLAAGWPADTPSCVVSRAGCADELASDQVVAELARAQLLHGGRPTVVIVGTGALPVVATPATLGTSAAEPDPSGRVPTAAASTLEGPDGSHPQARHVDSRTASPTAPSL